MAVIDCEQKFNQPFYYPKYEIKNRKNLIRLIIKGCVTNVLSLIASALLDDEFQFPIITQADLDSVLMITETVSDFDENGEEIDVEISTDALERHAI